MIATSCMSKGTDTGKSCHGCHGLEVILNRKMDQQIKAKIKTIQAIALVET